ncbi:hypothetical protein GCM10022207_85010 [Streptomyces lannensis]|uniref:Integrase n=1 Tax=Streptomyces lannensis TaxID=766498 RepID=A0ABP7LKF4_9ACTN
MVRAAARGATNTTIDDCTRLRALCAYCRSDQKPATQESVREEPANQKVPRLPLYAPRSKSVAPLASGRTSITRSGLHDVADGNVCGPA